MIKRIKYIIGIDEVGRGSLAGPVTVAAILLPRNFQRPRQRRGSPQAATSNFQKLKLKDSKKLSSKQREAWFRYIKESQKFSLREISRRETKVKSQKLYYAVASVSPRVIDKINIAQAANLAATRSLSKLVKCFTIVKHLTKGKVEVFLDGGLYVNKKLKIKNKKLKSAAKDIRYPRLSVSTIIKGDEKIRAIMLASIVAKVTRDRMMVKLHKKYPKYAFNKHKGYGTKQHRKAIKKYGLSSIHRKSFKIKKPYNF